jgi:hypothetical protein
MAKGSDNECFEGLDSVSIPASFSQHSEGLLYGQENEGRLYDKVFDSL